MPSSSERWIDRSPGPEKRSVEMQVFCFGLSRTGTWSLRSALDKLGYNTYHYSSAFDPINIERQHLYCWREALEAKIHNKGPLYGRAEFDKLLGEYSATTDAPAVNFAEDLLKAYPNAKVILNTRAVEPWLASIENSLYRIFENTWWRLLIALPGTPDFIRTHDATTKLVLGEWAYPGAWNDRDALVKGFERHYERIRSLVPKERLLEHTSRDGWEPICRFLGKEVPDESYPHANEGDFTWEMHKRLILWRAYPLVIGKLLAPVALAVGVGWWWGFI